MKINYSIAAVLILLTVVSCGSKDEKANNDTPAVTIPATSTKTDIPATTTGTTTVPAVSLPSTNTVTSTNGTPVNISPTITQQPAANATAKGMNPAHGQPGHRCDIAVGAPLNSPPAQVSSPVSNTNTPPSPSIINTAPTINTAPVINTTPAKPVAAGMNPEHGQPGHRCDISVGAPLNSPVSPNNSTPATKQEVPVKKDN
jgi:hypothetical protein